MKTQVDTINAVPNKRMFLSIIADYDVNLAICELVDNALDLWVRRNKPADLEIRIELEEAQQTVVVRDNAGGVDKSELSFIVGPGQTGNAPGDETIGIFGVGTKRAVVALAQDVTIQTRHYDSGSTYQIEFDDDWLKEETWELPVFRIDDLPKGTTTIRLQRLRFQIDGDTVTQLRHHLGATYAKFLEDDTVAITVNGVDVKPITFEGWSYPPAFPPHLYQGAVSTDDGRNVKVEVLAGLANESSPAGGEYGVYIYCNRRLIGRALKSYEVGFGRGLAGQPHPEISLVKAIVSIAGAAVNMPWNSSKSGINANHKVFTAIRAFLITVVKDFASLSRRLEGKWEEEVFAYQTGKVKEVAIADFPAAKKSYLPPLPTAKPRYGDVLAQANQDVVAKRPWSLGLYEGVAAADLIAKQKLKERNRIALIVLDSTLEIGFKEYLVNQSGTKYSEASWLNIAKNRTTVHQEVRKSFKRVSNDTWKKIEHYYLLRCKLIHERASVGVTDDQIQDYRGIVELVLNRMFGLKFEDL